MFRQFRNTFFWRPFNVEKLSSLTTGDYADQRGNQVHDAIRRETKVSRAHLTPEIALHLITPSSRLYHQPLNPALPPPFPNDPYWAFYWAGGQALSRFILDNPSLVAGKSVVDIGSGCGATAIACILSGAQLVLANDIDEVAGHATLMNCHLNNLTDDSVRILSQNLIGRRLENKTDIVLIGDLFYDAHIAVQLLPWLQSLHAAQGCRILIGDPGRHGITERHLQQLKKLATYELPEATRNENNGFHSAHVWQFRS